MFCISTNTFPTQAGDSAVQPIVQVIEQSSLSVFADWFTIFGLLLTVIGLFATFYQGRKTKKAAEAANDSAIKTAEKFESFQFTASLAMNIEKLKACHTLFKENKLEEIIRHLTDARDQIIVIRESLDQNSIDAVVKDELDLLKDLKDAMNSDIRNLHSKSLNDEFQLYVDHIYEHINNVHEYFIAKQSQIKKK